MANAVIRLPEVVKKTGKSRSSIYSDIKQGLFPRPIKIGQRAVAWPEYLVDRWIEDRIQEAHNDSEVSQ